MQACHSRLPVGVCKRLVVFCSCTQPVRVVDGWGWAVLSHALWQVWHSCLRAWSWLASESPLVWWQWTHARACPDILLCFMHAHAHMCLLVLVYATSLDTYASASVATLLPTSLDGSATASVATLLAC